MSLGENWERCSFFEGNQHQIDGNQPAESCLVSRWFRIFCYYLENHEFLEFNLDTTSILDITEMSISHIFTSVYIACENYDV